MLLRFTQQYPGSLAPKASIADLPKELLLIIFKFIHEDASHDRREELGDISLLHTPGAEGSDRLFPYAPAQVCVMWRTVMSMVSAFWAFVIIYVDQDPTPLPAIQSQMTWSRDQPLDITIARRGDSYTDDDPDEQSRVASVIQAIRPHLRRCYSLNIDVIYSSSLPSFPHDLHDTGAALTHLKLACSEDDGGPPDTNNSVDSSIQAGTDPFFFPGLTDLMIDGRNVYNLCRSRPFNWTTSLRTVQSLSISCFWSDGHERLTPCDIMRPLSIPPTNFHKLRLANLDLHRSIDEQFAFPHAVSASLFELEDLSDPRVVSEILDFISRDASDKTTITRCATSDFPATFFMGDLELEAISREDQLPVLAAWCGENLTFKNCPALDDDFLHILTTSMDNHDPTYATFLKCLRITDCPNFSVEALKTFVTSRRGSLRFLLESDEPPEYFHLFLSGPIPYFSPEDISWFRKRLSEFVYEPSVGGHV